MPVTNPKEASGQNTLLNNQDNDINSTLAPAPIEPSKPTDISTMSVTPKIETAPTPKMGVQATDGPQSKVINTKEAPAGTPAPMPWSVWNWQNYEMPAPKKEEVVAKPDQTIGKTPEQAKMEGMDSIIKSLDPQGSFSPEEIAAIKNAIGWEDPEAYIAALKGQSSILADKAKSTLDAYRTTRDLWLKQERTNELNQQRADATIKQYNEAIMKQKQAMDNMANNLWVVQGTAGRLKSRNMVNAIGQVLGNAQNHYAELVKSKDRDLLTIANDLKYETELIWNQYNDAVTSEQQDMLKKIASLDSTGRLNTREWLLQARNFVQSTLENTYSHSQQYYNALNALDLKYTNLKTEKAVTNKYDDNVTTQMNDWYLYNASWQRMTDPNGNYLKVTKPAGWTAITKEPISLPDGSMAMIYQTTWEDWQVKLETVKVSGTESPEVSWEMISWIAKAMSSGAINTDTLKAMNLSPSTIQQIVSQVVKEQKPWEWVEWTKVWEHYDENTWAMIDDYGFVNKVTQEVGGTINSSQWTVNSGSTDLSSLYTWNNWPAFANNNPWNIKDTSFGGTAWGQGGFTKFNSVEDWIKALMAKIEYNKANWVTEQNGSAYNWNMSLTSYFKKYAPAADNNNPVKYALAVAKGAWVTADTKIKDVPTDVMAMEIMKHENWALYKELIKRWILWPEGINLWNQTQEQEQSSYDPNKAADYKRYLEGKGAPTDLKFNTGNYNKFVAEAKAYEQENPEKNATLTDDQRTALFQATNQFKGNQVVKDYENMVWQTANIIASIGSKSWPWDIAAVYQFMKVLDPSSVVREGEFATAASSAWLAGKIGNMFTKLENWEMLNSEQKSQFKSLMTQYMKNKSKQYDRLYWDMKRVLDSAWVPKEAYPTSASQDAMRVLYNKVSDKDKASIQNQVYQDMAKWRSQEDIKKEFEQKWYSTEWIKFKFNTGTSKFKDGSQITFDWKGKYSLFDKTWKLIHKWTEWDNYQASKSSFTSKAWKTYNLNDYR